MTETASKISESLLAAAATITAQAKELRQEYVNTTAGGTSESDRINAFAVAKLIAAATSVREAGVAARQTLDDPEFAAVWWAINPPASHGGLEANGPPED